jgi:hypothetical protein
LRAYRPIGPGNLSNGVEILPECGREGKIARRTSKEDRRKTTTIVKSARKAVRDSTGGVRDVGTVMRRKVSSKDRDRM